jgi:hypothetical protein
MRRVISLKHLFATPKVVKEMPMVITKITRKVDGVGEEVG